MRDGIAQEVLDRAGHFLQHGTIEFHLAAADVEVGFLAQLLGRLPHDPVQPVGHRIEGNHAHAHQRLREFPVLPRLAGDGGIGMVEIAQKGMLNRGHVVHALGHHAGDFLEARKTVELEGIEFGVRLVGQGHARLHLGFGLYLDLPQLSAQTDYVLGQIEQGSAQGAHLALDARTRNRHFAGFVDQAIDQVRAHPQHGAHRRGFGFEFLGRHARRLGRRRNATGYGLFLGGFLHHTGRPLLQAVEQESGAVEGSIELIQELRRDGLRRERVLQARFHAVHQFAHPHGARHAGAALEGMQQPGQGARRFRVLEVGMPVAQLDADLADQIHRLFQENRQQLFVQIVL